MSLDDSAEDKHRNSPVSRKHRPPGPTAPLALGTGRTPATGHQLARAVTASCPVLPPLCPGGEREAPLSPAGLGLGETRDLRPPV